ncbi:MAG: 1-deoxy-D-xylulose-5-phosphate synthase [Planctomycetota bacterium]|nr:1-deoxy-D-xylulose-5-phosphate synthase [Planctomycetota bacterium]
MHQILSRVNHPHDLRGLSLEELKQLAGEIRARVAEVVDKNGGHFGSNLGTVELTLALHRAFDLPRDRLVWDTSHQTYPHKLITGRRDRFHLIRQYGGICGFCNKKESIFDLFDAGHAGTACSLGLGVCVADRLLGRESKSIAVVGDAAIAAGMAFEALNHAGELRENFLVILNDNRMSIDLPVGALSRYLNKFRSKPMYQDLKRDVQKVVSHIPVVGRTVENTLERVHDAIKHTVVPGLLFQELGFNYYGPVEGHDLAGLLEMLEDLKRIKKPILLHVHTEKGHGYAPALEDPVKYHALKNFLDKPAESTARPESRPESEPKKAAPKKRPTYSQVFKQAIHEAAQKDRRVVAITAAMSGGTGLTDFAKEFPDRYFDVGIAEQHGAAFSSGLAYGGLRPVFAVYSTFCQRAYDQFIHDTCIQENPVIYCLDRAGLSGEDGWTHHGLFDIAFMRCVPNCILMAPRDGEELIRMFRYALDETGSVTAIRYPKATVPSLPQTKDFEIRPGKAEVLMEGETVVLFAYGAMVDEAYRAALQLRERGIRPTVVNARFAKPMDVDLLGRLAGSHSILVTLEEHNLAGGFGSAVLEALADREISFSKVHRVGVPDRFVTFGSRKELFEECELAATSIGRVVSSLCSSATKSRLAGRPGQRLDVRV